MRSRSLVAVFAACLCFSSQFANAEVRTFTVDHSQSSLAFSGVFLGVTLVQQGPGSLNARYTGTIEVDLTASTLAFVGGSSVVASNSGSWEPLPGGGSGDAPANYGGTGSLGTFVTGQAAVRNILLDIVSPSLAITGTNFPAQNATFIVPSNSPTTFDYRYSGLIGSGFGTRSLANNSTNNVTDPGNIRTQGMNLILTMPVNIEGFATINTPNDAHYFLVGQIVATAPVSPPPPLRITDFRMNAGQLTFTIATVSNQSYAILGSSNLVHWNSTNDQFTATNAQSVRTIPVPNPTRQFFRVRRN